MTGISSLFSRRSIRWNRLAGTRTAIPILLASAGFIVLAPPAIAFAEGDVLGAPRVASADPTLDSKIARLEKEAPLSSTNYRHHYELANAYYDASRLEMAEARFRRVLELNPKYVKAMVNLGSVLSDMGKNQDAVEVLEGVLAIDPDDCKARSNLGNAYYALERYPDAMYEYKKAIEVDPKCHSACFNIAVAFADAGIFREAVKWWKEVVFIAPGTDASRQAQENIELLKQFTEGPVTAPK